MIDLSKAPEIMTPEDAARILRIPAHGVKELCRKKKMSFFRIGNRYRIGKNHIMDYLETCQSAIEEPASTGGRTGRSGKSCGSSEGNVDGVQQALTAASWLRSNSPHTSSARGNKTRT